LFEVEETASDFVADETGGVVAWRERGVGDDGAERGDGELPPIGERAAV
jgi:hypothetical protein